MGYGDCITVGIHYYTHPKALIFLSPFFPPIVALLSNIRILHHLQLIDILS